MRQDDHDDQRQGDEPQCDAGAGPGVQTCRGEGGEHAEVPRKVNGDRQQDPTRDAPDEVEQVPEDARHPTWTGPAWKWRRPNGAAVAAAATASRYLSRREVRTTPRNISSSLMAMNMVPSSRPAVRPSTASAEACVVRHRHRGNEQRSQDDPHPLALPAPFAEDDRPPPQGPARSGAGNPTVLPRLHGRAGEVSVIAISEAGSETTVRLTGSR